VSAAVSVPKVVLIGGAPCVGKSAVARRIAARYQYGCLSTDDIGKAVTTVAGPASTSNKTDWRDYFANTPIEELLEDDEVSRRRMWPAIEVIIRTHASWGDPIVVEGYGLWPDAVMSAGFRDTGALWLTCDDALLEARVRSQESFYEGAEDAEVLVRNFVKRSSVHTELIIQSAEECGADLITVKAGQSVEDAADLCVKALVQQIFESQAPRSRKRETM
jgi:2-phosphoglycerate kinase